MVLPGTAFIFGIRIGDVMGRRSRIVVAVLGALVIASCESANQSASDYSPVPAAINCADAPQLRQQALDDGRQRVETKSDQEKIVAVSRATFYASLAMIADLKCKVTSNEVDEALKPALEAARKAEATRSFYERAVHWGDAGLIAIQVVSMLTKELSAPPK